MGTDLTSIHGDDAVEKMLFCWHETERMTGLHLTLHDHIRAFIMPDNTCLLPDVNIHHNPCCDHPQRTRLKCGAHCRVEAMERAAAEGRPFRFQCWRGVTELVMPVYLGKVHAATVFAGAFRDPEFDLSRFPVSYRKKYQQLPVWDDARIPQLEQVLISASYSLLQLAANIRERYVSEPGRKGQIHRFFLYHFKEQVGVPDLASELNLSESRTVHLLKELFGKGFAELMNEERVRQAEEYLAKTDLPLREIARLTGFRNEYYLSYVFRRIRSCSPGSIRGGRKKKILEA